MSRTQAEWTVAGGVKVGAGHMLWIVAIVLSAHAGLAQMELVGVAAKAAEAATARDSAYLATFVMLIAMAFAWWQSKENSRLARESTVAAVETAQALQRLVDLVERNEQITHVDDDIGDLLKRRAKK